MAVTHSYVSGIADSGDPTEVRPSAWNDPHVISPPIECAAQCMIQADATTTNNADSGQVGMATGSFAAKNLMQFSLSGISAVRNVWLQFVITNNNNCLALNEGNGSWLRTERLLRTDINYSQATWNVYKTGSNWGTAGATNASDRTLEYMGFVGPFDAAYTASGTGAGNINRISVLTGAMLQMERIDVTAMVQAAIDASLSNIDLLLTAYATGGQNQFTIASRTDGTTSKRPKLVWE